MDDREDQPRKSEHPSPMNAILDEYDGLPNEAQPPEMLRKASTASKTKGGEEFDTCRICRGEGSIEEPLFYPCKCSGSIKYVHQSCLVEWLSHSQKKHCELCKTPFRFTKLYSPHMPKRVPIPVFFRQAALHCWKAFLTAARFQLVLFVWVLWLPWCTRTIWRGFFWIGDGAWVDIMSKEMQKGSGSARNASWPLLGDSKNATASALVSYFSKKVTNYASLFSFHYDSVGFKIPAFIYYPLFNSTDVEYMSSSGNRTVIVTTAPRSATWLSDTYFLKDLTRSTMINNAVIDTLEGQLITLFVVTAFILIFLIREWVMQQQQNLAIGPDGNVQEPAGPDIGAEEQGEANDGRPQENRIDRGIAGNAAAGGRNIARPQGHRAGLLQRPRMRLRVRPQGPGNEQPDPPQHQANQEDNNTDISTPGEAGQVAQISRDTDVTPSTPSADPDQEFESRFEKSREHDVLMQLCELSPTFRHAWHLSELDISEALNLVLDGKSPGEHHDLLMIMYWLRKSKYFQGESGERLRSWYLMGDLLRKTEARRLEDKDQVLATASTVPHQNSDFSHSSFPESGPEQSLRSITDEELAEHGSEFDYDSELEPGLHSLAVELRVVYDGYFTGPRQSETPKPVEGTSLANSSLLKDDHDEMLEISEQNTSPVNGNVSSLADRINESPERLEQAGGEDLSQGQDSSTAEHDDLPRDILDSSRDPASVSSNVQDGEEVQSHLERLKNWLWGGVDLPVGEDHQAGDDEQVVGNIAEEAPFVPVAHGQHLIAPAGDNENPAQDPEVVAAAAQAGINPNGAEVADEMEDLEGIMELVGMEGPILGLIQNGMFFAVLVSLTILFGIWTPYIFGKLFIIVLANPFTLFIEYLRVVSSFADVVTDLVILITGFLISTVEAHLSVILAFIMSRVSPSFEKPFQDGILSPTVLKYAMSALDRLENSTLILESSLPDTLDVPTMSAIAHESLLSIQDQATAIILSGFQIYMNTYETLFGSADILKTVKLAVIGLASYAKVLVGSATQELLKVINSGPLLQRLNPLHFNLASTKRTTPLDYGLAHWNGTDRAIAIFLGYAFFALLGMVYLRIAGSIQGTNKKGLVEGGVASVLYQAGGVIKVILIISIEMLLFPLYCGMLLDIAFLPLFDGATFLSRVAFTINSPWTSTFIHWFVGTCYMFHFALFVSMCRKIMRTGVLFFIRDPDDPTVHPVRDVLERKVSTQLWKISLSALVCGALVLASKGVVWGIGVTFRGIFPIHWSSNEPVLEFPVDLLFYNFLMPITIRFFRPSKTLKKVYGWWFRKSARLLRMSSFLLNESFEDEEGRHVRKTWADVIRGEKGDVAHPVVGEERVLLAQDRDQNAFFLRDGRFVRAPASDSVRIPPGASAFVEVDFENNRLDNVEDRDDGLHGKANPQFTKVYIPPHFRLRIAAFMSLVWLFATVTGICATIVPLAFGRWLFSTLTPQHLRMNDIYAFTIGVSILGTAFYALLYYQPILKYLHNTLTPHKATIRTVFHKATAFTIRSTKFLYTYLAFGVFLPFVFSLILEFYLIIPLHTYLTTHNPPNAETATASLPPSMGDSLASTTRPIIHLIQDWTLGVLYVKVFARVILWTSPSRPANALRAIVRHGWLNPDARLATRAFILPALFVMAIVLTIPLGLGWLMNKTILQTHIKDDEQFSTFVYRYSYPAVLAVVAAVAVTWFLGKAFRGWRRRVRDEVYLIGERLHNFGEGRKKRMEKGMSDIKQGKRREI